MDTHILEDIGLSKTEVRIYLTLLKTGQTTTTTLVREAGIHASKVYEFLDRLIQKGLVSYVIINGKKHFRAADPIAIKRFLREKQRALLEQEHEVDSFIPALLALQRDHESQTSAEIFQGFGGIKTIYDTLLTTLHRGDTQYAIGAPRIANERIEGYLLDWHERRIRKGICCKYIYDSNVRDYGRVREKMKYTQIRYLPRNIISPIWIEIHKDQTLIGHIKDFDAIVFLIKDKEIAKGYLDYFNLIWKISKT